MLISISDHYTRTKAMSRGSAAPVQRVLGCLLGQQTGRSVDISNSFELNYELLADGSVVINTAFLIKKQEQCKYSCMSAHSKLATFHEQDGVLQISKSSRNWTLLAGMPPGRNCWSQTPQCTRRFTTPAAACCLQALILGVWDLADPGDQ